MLLNYKQFLCDPRILLFLPFFLEKINIFFNIILPSELMCLPKDFKLQGKHNFWLFLLFFQNNLNEKNSIFQVHNLKWSILNLILLLLGETKEQTNQPHTPDSNMLLYWIMLFHCLGLTAFTANGTNHHYYLYNSLSSEYVYIHWLYV